LKIFEVDQPASQQWKRKRLAEAGLALPDLEFVAIDFEKTSLRDGLSRSSLDFDQPTFFSCLGGMVYTPEATEAVFRLVAAFPQSSEIVFTFSVPHSALPKDEAEHRLQTASAVESFGQPWQTHFEAEALSQNLHAMGYAEVSYLTPEVIAEKYWRGRQDLPVPQVLSIASAVVGERRG
jgi:methyltransferase (TIGR00027 family)